MEQRLDARVSEDDRDRVIEQLKTALEQGRLSLSEYDDRISRAAAARTHGDLIPLYADLMATRPEDAAALSGSVSGDTSLGGASLAAPTEAATPQVRAFPVWLRVVWMVWLTVVLINVTVWLLVVISTGDVPYFWPMWVAGPTAAALVGVTAIERVSRR